MSQNGSRLAVSEKISYGVGDLASCLFWNSFSMFLLYFYTDVFGLAAATAGTMIFLIHTSDAVIDPAIGLLADRTQTRWGKFRPWLLWMAVPFGVIGVLQYTTPDLSLSSKIVYAYATHLLMCMVYSAINVPYGALMGVMSPNSIERTSLSSYRLVFAFGSGIIVAGTTIPLVEYFGGNQHVVAASLAGNTLRLEEAGTGNVKLIVTADDGQGGVVRDTAYLRVLPADRLPPAVARKIDDVNLAQGFSTHRIPLAGTFDARGGQSLSYSATSSKESVVKAEISGNELVLTEAGPGTARVTASAATAAGAKAEAEFTVHVNAPGNRPPVTAGELPDLALNAGFGLSEQDLAPWFTDPDGDPLSYSVSVGNDSVLTAGVIGQTLMLHEKGAGSTQLTVTADDGRGGTAQRTVRVGVLSGKGNWFRQIGESLHLFGKRSEGTPCSVAHPIRNLDLPAGFARRELDVSRVFDPGDADRLALSVNVVSEAHGFQLTMSVFAVMSVLLFLITFLGTRERVRPDPRQKTSLAQDLKDLWGNRPWFALCLLSIFNLTLQSLRNASIIYYFKYYMGSGLLATAFLVTGQVSVIAGILLTKWLARRLGKRRLYQVSMLLGSVLTAAFYFVSAEHLVLLFVLQILVMFSFGPIAPLIWAMYADTADHSEWRTGRRATGLVFSAASFAQKIGWSVGGAIAGWMLAWFGFHANMEQSPETIHGMRLMFSAIPAALGICNACIVFLYRLDDSRMTEIEADLARRRAAIPAAEG